jgi:uncharacterized protein YabN with tetrapyrrole methylase and pyrophosphatase domain
MAKLIRRHPHVFGDAEAASAADVVERWHAIKRNERGEALGQLPEAMPALIRARKLQDRAERAGIGGGRHAGEAMSSARRACEEFLSPGWREEEGVERIGALLFDVVEAARALDVDPELALDATLRDFTAEVE